MTRALGTLTAGVLCIGAAAIFARFALTGTGPLAAAAIRLALAAVVVGSLLALRGEWGPLPRKVEAALILAGIVLAVHFGAWLASLEYTSVAISTLLVCTSPIVTGAYDALVRGRRPSALFGIAVALGAAGLWLVVVRGAAPAPVHGHALLGAALATLGAVTMAAYLVIVREARRSLSTLQIVARTYGWAAVALVAAAAVAREAPPRLEAGVAWGGLVAMALVSQVGGHTALNAALRFVSPTTVGFATLLEPVLATLLAAAIFGEAVGPVTALGGLLILAAVGFSLLDEERTVAGHPGGA